MIVKLRGNELLPDLDFGIFSSGKRYNLPENENVVLPESRGIKKIGMQTFINCDFMRSLKLPEGVTHISKAAFHNCYNLEYIYLPSTLKVIEIGAFVGCSSLSRIELPDGIEKIGKEAFPEETEVIYKGINLSRCLEGYPDKRVSHLEKLIRFVKDVDFSINLETKVKYRCLWSMYFNRGEDETLLDKIKDRLTPMLIQAVEDEEREIVEWALGNEGLITSKNIDKLLSSANKQSEIFVLLLNYKYEKIGFKKRNWFL